MKKFIISLLFLLIISGTVFYFGYVSFRVPEGSYGVALTRTNGYDHPVIAPGSFRWMWQGLLPTNLRLFHVTLQERTVTLDFNGKLPSAEALSNYAANQADFAVRVKARIRYRLQPEVLPQLFQRAGISAESDDYSTILNDTYASVEAATRALFSDTITSLIEDDGFGMSAAKFKENLETMVAQQIPQLQDFEITISEYSFPDLEIYRTARNNYLVYLNRSHEIAIQALETASSARTREISRIEVLKEYGALLQEYPVLLDYYSRNNSNEPLILLPEEQ
jgi:hypothetical protein